MIVTFDVKTLPFSIIAFRIFLFLLFAFSLLAGNVRAQNSDLNRGAAGVPGGSALSPELADLGGQWDLALENEDERTPGRSTCRLTLSLRVLPDQNFLLLAPAYCRKHFPIAASFAAWQPITPHRIDFADRNGSVVLTFFGGEQGQLSAVGPEGEHYHLTEVTLGKPNRAPIDMESVSSTKPVLDRSQPSESGTSDGASSMKTARLAAASGAGSHGALVKPEDLPGRYAVLREDRDTGCMITLDRNGARALLAPACRDHGIVVFDPVSWRLVRDHIVLTARKGHSINLDRQTDGSWKKDSADGKSLGLKKL